MGNTERLSAALADRYRILEHLGEGGMATVYLAEDIKHKRKVAVKVLRPELAAVLGADRFVQEIETTASLQHPHILPLFDSGEADGFLFYVMPYIEGETLRDKLDRETQLGVEQAVKIATEVADALEYAHAQGVIHRDIKPENILLHNDRPMVADFGIALAVSAAAGGRMTETGMSLGTPHHMSPEQATAEKDLTARSDIYSLASVLYEMLTGAPPHLGGSAQQIIMKIVTDTPRPVTELRKSVPPNVAEALAKALEKVPADRFDSAGGFAEALKNPGFTGAGRPAGTGVAGGRLPAFPVVAGMAMVGAVLAALGWQVGRQGVDAGPVEYDVGLPDSAAMWTGIVGPGFALAPSGDFVVYHAAPGGRSELWYRSLRDATVRRIPGSEGGNEPTLSPDGTRVAFVQVDGDARSVMILPVEGGTATTLGRSTGPGSLQWLPDGRILLIDNGFLRAQWLDPAGGPPQTANIAFCFVGRPVPGEDALLYDPLSGRYQTWIRRPLMTHAIWSPQGDRLLFGAGDSIFVGSPDRAGSPEFLLHLPGFQAMRWMPGDQVYGFRNQPNAGIVLHLDRRPVTIDSLFSDTGFLFPSADGRWIAYANAAYTEAWIEPLPRDGRRFLAGAASSGNVEDIGWLSLLELGVPITDGGRTRIERVTVDPTASPPVRNQGTWAEAPRFRDTNGPSFATAPGGGFIYMQGAIERPTPYLRVVPHWVDRMKRAVDEANR